MQFSPPLGRSRTCLSVVRRMNRDGGQAWRQDPLRMSNAVCKRCSALAVVHMALLRGLPTLLPTFAAFFDGTAGDTTKALQAFDMLADCKSGGCSSRSYMQWCVRACALPLLPENYVRHHNPLLQTQAGVLLHCGTCLYVRSATCYCCKNTSRKCC